MPSSATTAMVSPLCTLPPSRKARRISRSRSSENSRPMAKSRKTTPISAATSTAASPEKRPRPDRPMRTPGMRRPATARRRPAAGGGREKGAEPGGADGDAGDEEADDCWRPQAEADEEDDHRSEK